MCGVTAQYLLHWCDLFFTPWYDTEQEDDDACVFAEVRLRSDEERDSPLMPLAFSDNPAF